jgi:hypothetical protein
MYDCAEDLVVMFVGKKISTVHVTGKIKSPDKLLLCAIRLPCLNIPILNLKVLKTN